MGYIEQSSALLEAPCVFCGYRGAGYWQRGTHPESCPWHLSDGGIEARRKRLGTIVRALYRAQVLGSLEPVESAHQLTPAEAKSIRLELDFPDLDHLARSGGHGPDLASALRKIDAICNWPDCLTKDAE